ncbi:MAG: DUF177 domain-containing protein [Clostridia bacterium]|nr:DUF177 domain-containing protein [Clostridia bacterium]
MKSHGEQTKNTVVDVTKIYNGIVGEINLDFNLDIEDGTTGDYVFEEAPHVKAKIFEKARGRNENESYVALSIEVTGDYTCLCARCAKEVANHLCVSAEYGITRRLSEDSDEYVEAPDGLLDVGELARMLFYLELPQRVLCKEECKGLCPVCGTDLNLSTCSCKQVKKGNGLEDLKKLLDNYEEK